MKQIKEAKYIEVLVNIKYRFDENKLVQEFGFTVSNKKYLDYLFDARFLFKDKIESLISKMSLEDGYLHRIDYKDKVEIIYSIQEAPTPQIRKIVAYVPPFNGCIYCSKAVKEGDFVYCPEKNKHYHKKDGVNRCPVFRCKEEIIT